MTRNVHEVELDIVEVKELSKNIEYQIGFMKLVGKLPILDNDIKTTPPDSNYRRAYVDGMPLAGTECGDEKDPTIR